MNDIQIESLLEQIRQRQKSLFSEIKSESVRNSFIKHLESISKFYDEAMDYPEIDKVNFPEAIHIAYAVCHPECGTREFIVDGSTQECQKCGSTMFRTEVAEYKLSNA